MIGEIFYHGTTADSLKDIIVRGLKAQPHVYLASDKNIALTYMMFRMTNKEVFDFHQAPGLFGKKEYRGAVVRVRQIANDLFQDTRFKAFKGQAFFTKHDIPLSDILGYETYLLYYNQSKRQWSLEVKENRMIKTIQTKKVQADATPDISGIRIQPNTFKVAEKVMNQVFGGKVARTDSYYFVIGGIAYMIERAKVISHAHGGGQEDVRREAFVLLKHLKQNRNVFKRFMEQFNETFTVSPAEEKKLAEDDADDVVKRADKAAKDR